MFPKIQIWFFINEKKKVSMVTSVSWSKFSRSVRSKHHSKGAVVLYSETEPDFPFSPLPRVSITSFRSLWVIVSMVIVMVTVVDNTRMSCVIVYQSHNCKTHIHITQSHTYNFIHRPSNNTHPLRDILCVYYACTCAWMTTQQFDINTSAQVE